MITTFFEVHLKPGMEERFLELMEACKRAYVLAEGCQGFVLHQCVEDRSHYIMRTAWDSQSAADNAVHHTEAYHNLLENSAACFVGEPKHWYTETVTSSGRFRRFDDLRRAE
jgi:quinol monooxygenase YgiN